MPEDYRLIMITTSRIRATASSAATANSIYAPLQAKSGCLDLSQVSDSAADTVWRHRPAARGLQFDRSRPNTMRSTGPVTPAAPCDPVEPAAPGAPVAP